MSKCKATECDLYGECRRRLRSGKPPCASDTVESAPFASDNSDYTAALREVFEVFAIGKNFNLNMTNWYNRWKRLNPVKAPDCA